MTGELQETREEEVARVRSYLASQAMRRTTAQLVEAVQQAHQQFLAAVNAVRDTLIRATPCAGEWSTLDVLLHMRTIAAFELSSFSSVLVRGERPPDGRDALTAAPPEMTRTSLLADLEYWRTQLIALVLPAAADVHLDLTWSHPEFGAMRHSSEPGMLSWLSRSRISGSIVSVRRRRLSSRTT